MNKNQKIALGIGILLVAVYFGFLAVRVGPIKVGQATPGLAATISSTTEFSIAGNTVYRGAATSSNCLSRVITTGVGETYLSFTDRNGDRLTGQMGHVQAASTTVVYDSGLYGCDMIRVRSNGATRVRITESF